MPTDFLGACPHELGTTLSKIKPHCSYWVFGEEFGEPTPEKPQGYHHWQFFFQLEKNRPFSWVIKKLPGVHLELRKGTVEEAMTYCMKDGSFEQGGQVIDRPGQGARSDLEVFVEDCKSDTDKDLWVKHPSQMVRYYKVPDKVRSAFAQPRSHLTQLVWIFGPPGCGKTLYVTQQYKDLYKKNDKTKWWDGYSGQQYVLMDEVNDPEFDYNMLLMIGNNDPMQVQVKCGYTQFVAKVMVLVSNVQPHMAYQDAFLKNPDALCRRTAFYRASPNGPHQISLQPVVFRNGNWVDQGQAQVRHVDYPDPVPYVLL